MVDCVLADPRALAIDAEAALDVAAHGAQATVETVGPSPIGASDDPRPAAVAAPAQASRLRAMIVR